jgi:segregation and condensation protein B
MRPLFHPLQKIGRSLGSSHFAEGTRSAGLWLRKEQPAADVLAFSAIDPARVRTPKMARLEAVLLVADGAISAKRLIQLATLVDVAEVRTLVEELNRAFAAADSPVRVEQIASGYRLMTLPQFSFWLGKLHQREAELKLTPPALETLVVVAYRQPVTRADVESVRGVQCTEMLKQLMDRGLVRIAGEEDSLGRPFLYETTRAFLEMFGLKNLNELPNSSRLRRMPASGEPAGEPKVA